MKIPENIIMEERLLGEIIHNGSNIQRVVEEIQPDDFFRTSHKIIYQSMLNCYNKNIYIDLVSLTNEMKEKRLLDQVGGRIILTKLLNLGCSGELLPYYIQKVIEARKKRDYLKAQIEINQKLDLSWEEIENEIEKKLLGKVLTESKEDKSKFLSLSERYETIIKQSEWYYNNKGKKIGLDIGFPKLMANCPILSQDYIVLAGSSRLGKSIFVMNLVYNVAKIENRHTAFISCEMSREEIEIRLQSLHSGYATQDIMQGKIHPSKLCLDTLTKLPILIAEFGTTSIDKIRNKLRLLKKKYPDLCFVVIDAINFIRDEEEKSNRAQEITSISGKLRDLAHNLDIAILLVCQLPKMILGRPRLENIKDSGSIGYDADIVWFLYWDIDAYHKEQAQLLKEIKPPKTEIKVELIIEKQRRGIWGRNLILDFIPTKMYFGEEMNNLF